MNLFSNQQLQGSIERPGSSTRNALRPKKANHGKRPCSSFQRRLKRLSRRHKCKKPLICGIENIAHRTRHLMPRNNCLREPLSVNIKWMKPALRIISYALRPICIDVEDLTRMLPVRLFLQAFFPCKPSAIFRRELEGVLPHFYLFTHTARFATITIYLDIPN